jgi:Cof subfamily protein (haloacid dehalogenase superfamily)
MYKLIALDMDGTLLKTDKTISKATFDAIQHAKNKGVKVVLATGRPVKGIKKYLSELNLLSEDDYAVAFNGAVVQTTKNEKIIAENLLSVEDIKILYDLSKKLKVNIHALTNDECITPKISKYSLLEANMNFIPIKEVDFDTMNKDTTIVKIMFIDEEEILDKAIEQIPKEFYDKYTVVKSAPYFLEFLNKKVNKGVGVKLLAEELGIDMKDVICVGDHENDLEMVQYAGLGVAMENAIDKLKDAANFVTTSNDDDGVAHVINKFILE